MPSSSTSIIIPDDQRVLDRIRRHPSGASAIDIARASLGWRAKKHTPDSLTMIGLSIAVRLVGAGLIQSTKSNRFIATQRDAA